jgi:hypothetical protein
MNISILFITKYLFLYPIKDGGGGKGGIAI